MRRWRAVLLVGLAVLTLAPRTSWGDARWGGHVLADTCDSAGATKTLVVTIVPPQDWDTATFVISSDGVDWELVAGTSGCTASPGEISCPLENTGVDRQRQIRVTVRTGSPAPLGYSLRVKELDEL